VVRLNPCIIIHRFRSIRWTCWFFNVGMLVIVGDIANIIIRYHIVVLTLFIPLVTFLLALFPTSIFCRFIFPFPFLFLFRRSIVIPFFKGDYFVTSFLTFHAFLFIEHPPLLEFFPIFKTNDFLVTEETALTLLVPFQPSSVQRLLFLQPSFIFALLPLRLPPPRIRRPSLLRLKLLLPFKLLLLRFLLRERNGLVVDGYRTLTTYMNGMPPPTRGTLSPGRLWMGGYPQSTPLPIHTSRPLRQLLQHSLLHTSLHRSVLLPLGRPRRRRNYVQDPGRAYPPNPLLQAVLLVPAVVLHRIELREEPQDVIERGDTARTTVVHDTALQGVLRRTGA